ncbi:MAG: OadG family protein [Clostridia bacterium]|nr:OadG family protein [Clostridia bacterium]
MVNSLLDFVSKGDGNYYFENMSEAIIYALIGFLIVFVGIAIIILIIWLIGLLLRKTNNLAFLRNLKLKRKSKNVESEITPSISHDENEVPDEIKVAIIAAIMAYYSESSPKCEFKVKRIKRL